MAFVNEFIPASDFEKYGIAAINFHYIMSDYKAEWTIDRERDVYLRQVASGREEFAADKTYTLYWKGDLIELKLREQGDTDADGKGWTDYVLLAMNLPVHLEAARSEILSVLKEALVAYNGGGMYSMRTNTTATFNF